VEAEAGDIRLRCTIAEFDQLDRAEETEVVEGGGYGGGYGSVDAVQGYGLAGGMATGASGMGIGMGLGHRSQTVTHDAVPLGETEVGRGEHVHATDGEIGLVEGFTVDPGSGQVTHVLLQEGHLWGRKEVAIPISAVTEVDDGIRLNITKRQVEDLPLVGSEHPSG
jgi:sporulation protein YlmC with PRC-barrel domain